MTDKEHLLEKAKKARLNAYAPYSKFLVGAAIQSSSGKIYAGCNVENVAYPQGTCAEAGAIAAMIADGETEISKVLVIADSDPLVQPCGGCRQKLSEFAHSETIVYLSNLEGIQNYLKLGELLPFGFEKSHLNGVSE